MSRPGQPSLDTRDSAVVINEAINVLWDVRDFLNARPVISRTGTDPMHARDFDEGALLEKALGDLLGGLVRTVEGIDRLYQRLADLVERSQGPS